MRITQQMLASNMTTQLQKNLSRYEQMNEQVASGKKINRPSDDPIGTQKSLQYSSKISENEQFERNTDYALSWIETTDQAMSSLSDVLRRVKELGLQGANGSNSTDDKAAIAQEVDQLREGLKDIANTTFNGKYIFNGQKTDRPIEVDGSGNINYDNQPMTQRISPGSTIEMNVNAGEVFDADVNLFKVLDGLSQSLKDGDQDGVATALKDIDTGSQQVLNSWTSLGAKQSRVEGMNQRLKEENLSLQTLLSKNEDIDYAEAIMKLKSEESVYQASLSASARMIQPTLMDFLR